MPLISVCPVSLSSLHLERRVFELEHVPARRSSLSLSAAALRLDRLAHHRLGERDRFEQDRVLRVAERVAGDGVLQADDARRCRRPGRSRTSSSPRSGSAWTWNSLATFSFTSLPGLNARDVRLQHAGVDADEEPVAVRVPRRLEHQPAERLLRVGLPLLLLLPLRVRCPPPAGGRAGWAGSSVTASSSGWMPMCSRPAAGTARGRSVRARHCSRTSCRTFAGSGSLPSSTADVIRSLSSCAVSASNSFSRYSCGLVRVLFGDVRDADRLAGVARVEEHRLHLDQVDDARERRAAVGLPARRRWG